MNWATSFPATISARPRLIRAKGCRSFRMPAPTRACRRTITRQIPRVLYWPPHGLAQPSNSSLAATPLHTHVRRRPPASRIEAADDPGPRYVFSSSPFELQLNGMPLTFSLHFLAPSAMPEGHKGQRSRSLYLQSRKRFLEGDRDRRHSEQQLEPKLSDSRWVGICNHPECGRTADIAAWR